ncbi:hypothetical protein [Nonomuraea sp. NPDC059022]|uniref:hypothetical protein n=1 Tax=Nonomuraea sp. NPDC059022 TaxID=3346705 RepID=UPI0036A7BDB9
MLKAIVAPSETCSSTPLRRWTAPVRNRPGGTSTRPPPARWHAAMARRKAAVQSVTPSPAAPKAVMSHFLAGKRGGLILRRM